MFFDIKVNQIGKILENFVNKIYEGQRHGQRSEGSSMWHESGNIRVQTASQMSTKSKAISLSDTDDCKSNFSVSHRSRKVIQLVLDFSMCITEVGASQLKMAAVDMIKQVKQGDFVQVIIQNTGMPVLISGSQSAREIEFSEQFEPFRAALQDATYDDIDGENATRLSLVKKAIGEVPVIAPVVVATKE